MLGALGAGQMLIRLGGLLLVPLFLHRWSATHYGEWLALSAVAGYLTLVDPGMHLAAINRLTQLHARGDVEEFRRVQQSALGAYVMLAAAGSLLVALGAASLPIAAWLRLSTPPPEAAAVVSLLAAYVLWSLPARLVWGTYQTLGSGARSQWVSNAQQTLGIVGVVLVLLLGGGMVALAALQLAVMLAATAAVIVDLHRRVPAYAPRWALGRPADVKQLVRPSAFFSMLSFANLLTQQGAVLVVSGALGGAAVAVFSVSRTVATLPRQAIDALSWALWPEIARLDATHEAAALRPLHKILVALSAAVPIVFAAGLWCEGPALIALWTQGRLEADATLLRLLLALAVLQAPWLASGLFTMAVNRHQAFATAYLAGSVSGIVLAWALVGRAGVLAVPLGLLAGEAIFGYHFVLRAGCRMLGEPYGPFALRLWTGVTVLAALGVGVAGLIHGLGVPSAARALLASLTMAALAAPLVWSGWLTTPERMRVAARVRAIRERWAGGASIPVSSASQP